MTARDDADRAGKAASAALSEAQEAILAAMASGAARAIRGTVTPQGARRRLADDAAAELGRASAALRDVYARAVCGITGKDGPLPDAPAQVAAAVLRAQQDADTAFGAVLAAALGPGNGTRMPPPSSPYRRIAGSAARQPTPAKAAAAALDAIGQRGLTGYVTHEGRRVPLAAYGQQTVKAAAVHTARMPAVPEITARRSALAAKHEKAVTAAWAAAVQGLDVSQAAAAFQGDSRMASAAGSPAVAARWRQEAAQSAASALLGGVYRSAGWDGFQGALEAMTADGMAEGEADAMLLAASRQHVEGFSAAAAFAAALAGLRGDMSAARQAQETAGRIVTGAAADTARALAGAGGDGEEDAGEALENGGAASRWTNFGLWAAFGAGAMALYRRLAYGDMLSDGILIDWIDSASACVLCQQNAGGSPYAPADVPSYPGHNHCQCVLSTSSSLPVSLLSQFAGTF
jgi:hypothetical protein